MLWRTLVCCLVLAGVVSATAWEPSTQFQYLVETRTLTALPDVAQVFTGSLMKLKLVFTSISSTEFTAKITSAKDASVNPTHLPGGWASEIPQQDLRWGQLPLPSQTFVVKLHENGTMKYIGFDKGFDKFGIELITAAINQFLFTTSSNPSKKQPFVDTPIGTVSKSSSYEATEVSSVGECKVHYVVNTLSPVEALRQHNLKAGEMENHLTIERMWNLTSCKRMKKTEMGLSDPENFGAGGNAQLPISRSMQSRIVINGDLKNFTITQIETNSTFFVPPQLYNKQKAMVVTNFKATLISKARTSRLLPRPQKPEGSENYVREQRRTIYPYMEYESPPVEPIDYLREQGYGWNADVDLPYHMGYNGRRIADAPGRNISELMVSLAEEISEIFHDDKDVLAPLKLSQVIVAVKYMRTMNLEEILAAHNIIVQKQQQGEIKWTGKVLRNIAALSGTPYSIQSLFVWLEKEIISIKEFAQHFSVQREVAFIPNKHYLEILAQIAMAVDKMEHQDKQALYNLRATVALTFTDILRMAGRKHTQLTNRVVNYYITRMEEAIKAKNNEELQLIIRVLGNIANKGILKAMYEIINGERGLSEHLRLHALVSLDLLTTIHPTGMRKFWWSVYANASLPHQLRCQAVPNIMRSNPPAWILQQMAEATHNESNPHVIAQVASAIRTAAELRGRFNEELARNARAAVHLLKPQVFDASYSGALFDSYKIDGMDLSYTQSLNYIGSQDSLLPSAFQYFVNKNYNGYRPLDFQASGIVTSINDTLEAILSGLFRTEQQNSPINGFGSSKAFPGIHVQRRSKLEGNLNIPGYGFWSFDEESVQKKVAEIIVNADSGIIPLETMKMSNAREVIFAVPSGLGQTFVYTYTTVQLASIKGNVRLQRQFDLVKSYGPKPPASKSKTLSVNLNGECDIEVKLAMREESKVGFVTPWNSLDYMSGVNINTQVHTPINASVGVEFNSEWNDIKVNAEVSLPKTKSVNLIHRSSEPYVANIWLLGNTETTGNPNTTLLHTKPPVTTSSSWGKGSTGMVMRLDYYSEIDASYENLIGEEPQFLNEKSWWSAAYRWLYQQWKGYNIFSLIHFPFASRDLHISNVNVTYDSLESTANSARFTWRLGGFPTPAGIIGALRAQKQRYHPRSLGVPLAVEGPLEQQISDAGSIQRQLLLNASFEGQTVAVFGLHGALRTNVMNQSLSSTVQLWSKPAARQEFNAALELSLQVPEVSLMNFKEALQASPNSSVEAALTVARPTWGKSAVVMLTGKLGRTPQRQEYISESPVAKACLNEMESGLNILPACQYATNWANSLDAYELNIRYKHVPVELKRAAFSAYSTVRQAAFSELQEEIFSVNPAANTISVGLYINNQDTAFNFSLQSNLVNANVTNYPLPSWAKPIAPNAGRSLADRIGQHIYPLSYEPSFVWDHGHVITFDGKSYPLKATSCWYIALAYTPKWQANAPVDQPQVYQYNDLRHVVLLRETEDGLLETRIIEDDLTVELRGKLHSQTPEILVNGEVLNLPPGKSMSIGGVADIYILLNGEVALHFYDSHISDIFQDSYRLRLIPSHCMRESASGLAGNYNTDPEDDFRSPRGCVRSDYEAFQAEWADCKLPSKQSKCVFVQNNSISYLQPFSAPQRNIRPYADVVSNIFDDFDSSSESSESQESQESPVRGNVGSFLNVGGRVPQFALNGQPSSTGAGGQISVSGIHGQISSPQVALHPTVMLKTDILRLEGNICFSINPIRKCKGELMPNVQVIEEVPYHCMPQGPTAQMYVEHVERSNVAEDFKWKAVHRSMFTVVPKECSNN